MSRSEHECSPFLMATRWRFPKPSRDGLRRGTLRPTRLRATSKEQATRHPDLGAQPRPIWRRCRRGARHFCDAHRVSDARAARLTAVLALSIAPNWWHTLCDALGARAPHGD